MKKQSVTLGIRHYNVLLLEISFIQSVNVLWGFIAIKLPSDHPEMTSFMLDV